MVVPTLLLGQTLYIHEHTETYNSASIGPVRWYVAIIWAATSVLLAGVYDESDHI